MPVDFKQVPAGATSGQLTALVPLVGLLDPKYQAFLVAQDGGMPEENAFHLPAIPNGSGITEFLSTTQIAVELDRYRGRLRAGVFPIAHALGGNLVCIDGHTGQVLYFDHEFEHREPLSVVAATFGEFWESLRPFDTGQIQLKPGQVKSVWVNPDLLKKYGRKP